MHDQPGPIPTSSWSEGANRIGSAGLRQTRTAPTSRRARRAAFGALAATAALVLAACGGTSDNAGTGATTQATAASDGVLTIYSGRSEELVAPVITAAEAALGIDIDVRYASTSELAIQLVEEGDATPADLFFAQDGGALGAVSKAGLFTALPASLTDRVADTYRAADGTWVGITGRARVLVVDPTIADEVPTSIYGLTDPQWKGKVGMAPANASFQAFITAMRLVDGEDAAEQWLRDMIANDVQIYESNSQMVEAVDGGQLSIGLVNHYYLNEVEREAGRTLKAQLVFTSPGDLGSLVNVAGVGMTAKGASDPDALAFIEYLLSDEGQAYFVETTNEYGLVANAPAPVNVPALSDITVPPVSLNDLDDLSGTLDLLVKVGLI